MNNDNRNKKKVTHKIILELSSNYSKNQYINSFIKLSINILLFIVIVANANIATFSSIYDIAIFAMWFSLLENIFVKYCFKYFTKYVLMSFGSLLIIPIILSMTLAYFINQPLIIFRTTEILLGFSVVFMTLRKILTILLLNFISRKRLSKLMKEKGVK